MITKPNRVTRMIWKGTNEKKNNKTTKKKKNNNNICSISQERSETRWVERLIRNWSAFLSSNYALRERSLRLMTSVRLPFGVCSCNHRLSLRADAPWSKPLPTSSGVHVVVVLRQDPFVLADFFLLLLNFSGSLKCHGPRKRFYPLMRIFHHILNDRRHNRKSDVIMYK